MGGNGLEVERVGLETGVGWGWDGVDNGQLCDPQAKEAKDKWGDDELKLMVDNKTIETKPSELLPEPFLAYRKVRKLDGKRNIARNTARTPVTLKHWPTCVAKGGAVHTSDLGAREIPYSVSRSREKPHPPPPMPLPLFSSLRSRGSSSTCNEMHNAFGEAHGVVMQRGSAQLLAVRGLKTHKEKSPVEVCVTECKKGHKAASGWQDTDMLRCSYIRTSLAAKSFSKH